MDRINPCLMLAWGQRRSLEDKAVPVIIRALGLTNIRAKLRRDAIFDEPVIYKQLHFDPGCCISPIDNPTGDAGGISLIQPTAKVRIRCHQIKTQAEAGDQQRLGDRLRQQKLEQVGSGKHSLFGR